MMEWPLEDVVASPASIKVPHSCILYCVYRGEYFYLFAYNHIGIVLEFQYFFGKVLTFGKKNSSKF